MSDYWPEFAFFEFYFEIYVNHEIKECIEKRHLIQHTEVRDTFNICKVFIYMEKIIVLKLLEFHK